MLNGTNVPATTNMGPSEDTGNNPMGSSSKGAWNRT